MTPEEVAQYLKQFAAAVADFYPCQEPLPAGSHFEGVDPRLRRARCLVDGQSGTLRVLALVLDGDSGQVVSQRDDTACFAASLVRRGGAQSRAGAELCDAFARRRHAVRRDARVAQLLESPGEVFDAAVLRQTPDGNGWRVTLLPERLPAVLPHDQELHEETLHPGIEVPVVVLPSEHAPGRQQQQRGPPTLRVSRRDASLVTGLLKRHSKELAEGSVRVLHAQRAPGRITKIAVENADDATRLNARQRVVGEDMKHVAAVREALGGTEVVHVIDGATLQDDPASFVAATLWPGRVAHVELGVGPEGMAVAYTKEDEEIARAVGKGGANIATASALCRKLLGATVVPGITVRSVEQAAADGVSLAPPESRGGFSRAGSRFGDRDRPGGRDRDFGSTRRGAPRDRFADNVLRPGRQPSSADDEALLAQLGAPPSGAMPTFDDSDVSSFWGEDAGAGAAAGKREKPAVRLSGADEALFGEIGGWGDAFGGGAAGGSGALPPLPPLDDAFGAFEDFGPVEE